MWVDKILKRIDRRALDSNESRLPGIIEELKRGQYEVICLQETFSPLANRTLRRALAKERYECVHDKGLINTSGLHMFVRKLPSEHSRAGESRILETHSQAFNRKYTRMAAWDDSSGTKGFLAAKIDNGDGTFTTVITTHLIAGSGKWLPNLFGYDLPSEIRRDKAFGDIRDYVLSAGKEAPAGLGLKCAGIILTGDTNQWGDSEAAIHAGVLEGLDCEHLRGLQKDGFRYCKPNIVLDDDIQKEDENHLQHEAKAAESSQTVQAKEKEKETPPTTWGELHAALREPDEARQLREGERMSGHLVAGYAQLRETKDDDTRIRATSLNNAAIAAIREENQNWPAENHANSCQHNIDHVYSWKNPQCGLFYAHPHIVDPYQQAQRQKPANSVARTIPLSDHMLVETTVEITTPTRRGR